MAEIQVNPLQSVFEGLAEKNPQLKELGFDSFNADMQDSVKLQSLYDGLSSKNPQLKDRGFDGFKADMFGETQPVRPEQDSINPFTGRSITPEELSFGKTQQTGEKSKTIVSDPYTIDPVDVFKEDSITSGVASAKQDNASKYYDQAQSKVGGAQINSNITEESLIFSTPEEEKTDLANNILERSQRQKNAVTGEGDNFGVTDALRDRNFWTIGSSDLSSMIYLKKIANKLERGESLTNGDKSLLEAWNTSEQINQQYPASDANIWYKTGKNITDMVPWLIQFSMTRGLGSSVTKGVETTLKANAEKYLGTTIAKGLSKGLAETAGAYAAASLMPNTYADITRRTLGETYKDEIGNIQFDGESADGNIKAIYKGWTNSMLEVLTERLGEGVGGMLVTKWPKSKLAKFIAGEGGLNATTNLSKFTKSVGWDGAPMEYFEEFVNTPLNALLVGDSKYSDVIDGKQQLETLMTVVVMGQAMKAVNATQNKMASMQADRDYKSAKSLFNSEIDPEVRTLITDVLNSDGSLEEQGSVLHDLLSTLEGDKAGIALNYIVQNEKFNQRQSQPGSQQTSTDGPQFTVDPRFTEQQQANLDNENNPTSFDDLLQPQALTKREQFATQNRQQAEGFASKTSGNIQTVEIITMEGTENIPGFVTGSFQQTDPDGKIKTFYNIVEVDNPNATHNVSSESVIEVGEQSIDDYVNGRLQIFDQEEADAQFAAENQMEFNGQILSRINRPEAKQEGFEYFYDENKQLVEVPNEEVQKWEQQRAEQIQLDQNKEAINSEVAESINNESVTTLPDQDNGLKANDVNTELPTKTEPTYKFNGNEISKEEAHKRANKAILLNDKTKLDGLEHSDQEIYDKVDKQWPKPPAVFKIKGKKVNQQQALDFIEVADDASELSELKHENIESDPIVAKAYQEKIIQFTPQVAQNVNNSETKPEIITENTDQNAVDQFDALFETENNQQNISQNEKPVENVAERSSYGNMAADYLLTGGSDVILSSDYFIQALSGVFTHAGSKIDAIRKKYFKEFTSSEFGDVKNFVGTDLYNKIMSEIQDAVNSSYGNNTEIQDIFNQISQHPTGLPYKLGQQINIRIDELNNQLQNENSEKVAPEEQRRQALRDIMDATGDDLFIMGVSDGTFAGDGLLNMDADGNVILTRHTSEESMLTKSGKITSPEELSRVAGTFSGEQIATSGVEGGAQSFTGGVVGEYKIPMAELLDLIKQGYVQFVGLGNKEFALSPHIAAKYLSSINGKTIETNQNNEKPAMQTPESLPESGTNQSKDTPQAQQGEGNEEGLEENVSEQVQYKTNKSAINHQKELLSEGLWRISVDKMSDVEYIKNDSKIQKSPGEYPEEEKVNDIISRIKNGEALEPIVLDSDYMIMDGHHRFEAAKELGIKTIPVIFVNTKQSISTDQPVVESLTADPVAEKKETREELENRLLEERKQRILTEGTHFDKEFGLIQPKDIKNADDVLLNINKIISTLKANEGNGKLRNYEGYVYGGSYSKNAGEQVRGYLMALDVLPEELRNQLKKDFAAKINTTTVQELMDWAAKQYKDIIPTTEPIVDTSLNNVNSSVKNVDTSKVEPLTEEQRITANNKLVDMVDEYNSMPKNHVNKKRIAFQNIQAGVQRLGYSIAENGGKLEIQANGKKIQKIGTKQTTKDIQAHKALTDYPEEVQSFIQRFIDNPTELFGLDLHATTKQAQQGIKNIQEGKKTVASNEVLDSFEKMFNDGVIRIKGSGVNGYYEIPIDEYLSAINEQLAAIDVEKELDSPSQVDEWLNENKNDQDLEPIDIEEFENDLENYTNGKENINPEEEAGIGAPESSNESPKPVEEEISGEAKAGIVQQSLFPVAEFPIDKLTKEEKRIKEKLDSLTPTQLKEAKKGIESIDKQINEKLSAIKASKKTIKDARKQARDEYAKDNSGKLITDNVVNSMPLIRRHTNQQGLLQREYLKLIADKEKLIDNVISGAKTQNEINWDAPVIPEVENKEPLPYEERNRITKSIVKNLNGLIQSGTNLKVSGFPEGITEVDGAGYMIDFKYRDGSHINMRIEDVVINDKPLSSYAEVEVKEPWQMTFQEYLIENSYEGITDEEKSFLAEQYIDEVESAISSGKEVDGSIVRKLGYLKNNLPAKEKAQDDVLKVDDRAIVKGKNGNPDFEGSFRGWNGDKAIVWIESIGSQWSVDKEDVSKKKVVPEPRKPLNNLLEDAVKESEIPVSEDGLYQIYAAKAKNKDGGIDNFFVVPSVENKESRGFGDDMFKTLPEAIEQVRLNRIEEVELQKEKAEKEKQKEIDAQIAAEKQARKEANKGKSILEIMNDAKTEKILDTKVNFNGEIKTRREHTEDVINNGGHTETKEVNKIKDPSRQQWSRMNEKEQSDSDRRIKEGGTKTEYRLYGNSGSFNEVTKAEYDYANSLIAVKAREEKKKPWLNIDRLKNLITENPETISDEKLQKLTSDLNTFYWMYSNEDLKSMAEGGFIQGVKGESSNPTDFVPVEISLQNNLNSAIERAAKEVERRKKQSTPLPEEKQAEKKSVMDIVLGFTYSTPESFNEKSFDEFNRALAKGEVGVEEFKKAFEVLLSSKDAIISELNGMTKVELLKGMSGMGQYRYKNEKKDAVVKSIWSDHLMDFAFGSISYSFDGTSMDQIVAKKVAGTTQKNIDDFVAETQKRKEEYLARVQEFKKALTNPETLPEFKIFIDKNGLDKLSPEQKAAYDNLVTDKTIERRNEAIENKAVIGKVDLAGVEMDITETKHTKTGADLFVVKLSERVSKEDYQDLNSKAKQLGGYYSSFRGQGAVPGFQFKTREQAQKFVDLKKEDASNLDLIEEKQDTKLQDRVSKLRDNAQKIIDRVDTELSRDRLTNTAKRASQAASTEARLGKEKQIAQTMMNIADAIENGDVKLLDGIKAKTHIELLDGLINQAKYKEIQAKYPNEGYEQRKSHDGEPATVETIEYAKDSFFPNIYAYHIKTLVSKVGSKAGVKLIAARWDKKLSATRGQEYYQTSGQREIDELTDMVNALTGNDKDYSPVAGDLANYNRLKSMGIENDSMLRAALREYVQYRGKSQEVDKVKKLERALVGRKNIGIDFFPTPKETAKLLVDEAGIEEGMSVLEPSAGNGNIADAINETGVRPDVIELSSALSEVLEAKGYDVVASDFMEFNDKKYDRIVMNPPFSNGMDGDHVMHAYELLKPGGKLVAIVGEGTFIRNDKKATAFREWLDSVGGTEEKLNQGTFQDKTLLNTTGANARMVIIEKGESASFRILGETGAVNDNSTDSRSLIADLEAASKYQSDVYYMDKAEAAEFAKGKVSDVAIGEIKKVNWMGLAIDNNIIINPSVTDKIQLFRTWAHEKAHIQIRNEFPSFRAKKVHFIEMFKRISPEELTRVLGDNYANKPDYIQAEEYYAHLAEEYAISGDIKGENVQPEIKNHIFDIVDGFISIKTIKDVINNHNRTSQRNSEVERNTGGKGIVDQSSDRGNSMDEGNGRSSGQGSARIKSLPLLDYLARTKSIVSSRIAPKQPENDNNINFKKDRSEPLTDKLARAKSEVEKNKADRLAAQEARINELIPETPKSKETHYNHTLIKGKLAAFKLGYKAGSIDRILNTKLIQNEIIKYANANMPMEEAGKREIGKLLTSVKNATTPRALEKAFAQIDDMTTQVRKSTAINAISKLLNDNRPKLVSGKFVGRLDPDVYKTLDKIREIVKITDPAQLDKYIDAMDMDDVENISLVATFGRLSEKTADEIDEALAKLSDIVIEGKLWYKAALEKRQKYNEGLRNKVVDKITGNKGLTNEQDLISSGKVIKTGSIGRFINAHINFEWLLDKISKDKSEETGRGWMQEYFGDLTTKSTNEESKGIRRQTELIHQKAAEIFGVDGKKLAQRFHENSKVVDKSGVTYINAVGERVELPLSQNQAYKKWMESQDINLSKTFERMGWDATTFKQLEKFILPDVKEWAEWQIKDFYANYYNGVNEKFREAYFANLGHSENYSPIKREVTDVTSGDDAMLQKAHVLASVGNQSLKARQTNVHNLLLKDGDTVLAMHVAEMEHFKAWVMEINEIRSVFNSRQVQHAIKTNFGQSVLTNLNDQIADMARGGEDRANIISFVDRIRRNFVTAELGGNISLFPKQSVSLLAYLSEVPVKNYALGLIDLAANLRTAIKTISKNEMVIERFQKGWAPEIKAAMKQDESGAFSQSRNMLGDIRNWLLFPTKAGDYAAVIGGWIVYKYEYDNQIALGKSKQEASEYALNKVDRSVSRTQQSGALKDVSQIQKGSWNKVLTMFKSSPIQQFRYENAAFRNIKNGRGSAINNAKIIAVYHFLIPMMFQFISNLFTDDDDDKERNRIIRAGLLGSANSLLIAGDIAEMVLEKIMGETWGDFTASPIEGSIEKIGLGFFNISTGLKDLDKEKVLKGVDQLLYGVNNVSIGLPYRPTKKLWKQGNSILGTESARKLQGEEIFNNSRLYLQASEDAANYNDKKLFDKINSSEWIDSYRKIQGNYSENIAGLKSNINSLKKENQTVGITPEGKKQNEVYIDNNQKAIDEIYMKIADEYSKVKFPKKY